MKEETGKTFVRGTIKPLEWVAGDFCGQPCFYADNEFGVWMVVAYSGLDGRWAYDDTCGNNSDYDWDNAEAAKSAAQADYEARILAQIDQAPEVQPVAWRYRSIDKPTVWSHLTDHRRTVYGRIGMEEQPLYAQPAPCASKSADTDPQPALSDTDAPQAGEAQPVGGSDAGWQPIETAPNIEGQLFLLFEPHEEVGFMFAGCRNNAGDWMNNLDMDTQHPTHWMPLPLAPDAPQAARAEVSAAEAATIPADVVELVLRIGRAEWGATAAKSAEEHAADLINSIRLTDENFKTEGPHRMDGLYIEGTEIVICHSGTSPNSPAIAQALTGAWNRLHDEATALRALTEAGE